MNLHGRVKRWARSRSGLGICVVLLVISWIGKFFIYDHEWWTLLGGWVEIRSVGVFEFQVVDNVVVPRPSEEVEGMQASGMVLSRFRRAGLGVWSPEILVDRYWRGARVVCDPEQIQVIDWESVWDQLRGFYVAEGNRSPEQLEVFDAMVSKWLMESRRTDLTWEPSKWLWLGASHRRDEFYGVQWTAVAQSFLSLLAFVSIVTGVAQRLRTRRRRNARQMSSVR